MLHQVEIIKVRPPQSSRSFFTSELRLPDEVRTHFDLAISNDGFIPLTHEGTLGISAREDVVHSIRVSSL